jgi:hypothetical protein
MTETPRSLLADDRDRASQLWVVAKIEGTGG